MIKENEKREHISLLFDGYIARKYNISVNELKIINNLSNDNLSISQLLKVPSGLSLVNSYIVEKGDTLYSISKKYNISVNELKAINNLTNNDLFIGQLLSVPSGLSSVNSKISSARSPL